MSISIQKRGKRWTANVRLNGHSVSETFDLKDHAKDWTQKVRRAIQAAHAEDREFDPDTVKMKRRKLKPGDSLLPKAPQQPTQADIDADPTPRVGWSLRRSLEYYDDTVTDALDGARQVRARIGMWKADPLAAKRLDELTATDINGWIAARTKSKRVKEADGTVRVERVPVAASTIRNDIYRISALYEHARMAVTKKEHDVAGWGLTDLSNPVAAVTLPTLPPGRQRRLDHGDDQRAGEEDRVLAELRIGLDGDQMIDFVTVAIETGMRRSEVLGLVAQEIRSTRYGRVIEIPREKTKNGHPRRIVLTDRATEAIDRRRAGKQGSDRLFTLNADAVATRWDIAREKAGCPDLRMHDIRHEALSRMADAGLSVGALAAQSGHRTMQTLLRYVNASERDIRNKLRDAGDGQPVLKAEPMATDQASDRLDAEFARLISQKA